MNVKMNIIASISYSVEVYSSPIEWLSLNVKVTSLLEGHSWVFGVWQNSGQLNTEIKSFGVEMSPMIISALQMGHVQKKFRHGFSGILTMNYIQGGTGFGVWSDEKVDENLAVLPKLPPKGEKGKPSTPAIPPEQQREEMRKAAIARRCQNANS